MIDVTPIALKYGHRMTVRKSERGNLVAVARCICALDHSRAILGTARRRRGRGAQDQQQTLTRKP
jgi:hypothetical protein